MEEQSTRAEYRCRSIVVNGARAGEGVVNQRSSNAAKGRMHGNIRGELKVEGLKSENSSNNNNNDNSSSSFDCNICLESAMDPVVTLCGHLFCWPCIYRWLRSSHVCPVCKAAAKEGTLVPLYGGGSAKAGPRNVGIPNRPTCTRTPTPAPVIHTYTSPGDYMSHQPYPYPYPYPYPSSFNHYVFSTGLPLAGYELSPFFAFQCGSVGPSLPYNRYHEAFLEKLFAFVLCFVFVCLISF